MILSEVLPIDAHLFLNEEESAASSSKPRDVRGKEYSTLLHDVEITPRELTFSPDGVLILSKEDKAFWGDYPPSEVIVATGSVRKAIQLSRQLNGFKFPSLNDTKEAAENPMTLQTYFDQRVYNGNKQLQQKTLVGYLYGVPVFAEPQDGESASNDNPEREARSKVKWVWEAGGYKGKNVLIISSDTVDQPSTIKTYLGKPMYYPSYPRLDSLEMSQERYEAAVREFEALEKKARQHAKKSGVSKENLESDIALARPRFPGKDIVREEFLAAQEAYLRLFKLAYYPVGTTLSHFNAIAVLDGNSGKLLNHKKLKERKVRLSIKVNQEDFNDAEAKEATGGGGLFQQFVDWNDEVSVLMAIAEEQLKEKLENADENFARWALYCTIIGMPFVSMKQILMETNNRRKTKKVKHVQ